MVSRRTLLKGLGVSAGALLLSPMIRRLDAQSMNRKRLIILLESDCLNRVRFTPARMLEMDAGNWDTRRYTYGGPSVLEGHQDTDQIELREGFAPLARHADDITLIQGLSNRGAHGTRSHSADTGALSCTRDSSRGRVPGGVTIDRLLGDVLGSENPFPSIALGADKDASERVVYSVSAFGADRPAPVLVSPAYVWERLFGSVLSSTTSDAGLRPSLLDGLLDDVRGARSRLASQERHQFDAYLHALEAVESRQVRLGEVEESMRNHTPEVTDFYTSPHLLERLEAQADIAFSALVAGMTDIVLLSASAGTDHFMTNYTSVGAAPSKHHFTRRRLRRTECEPLAQPDPSRS